MAVPAPRSSWWRDDVAVALALATTAFALAAGDWLWRADRVVYDAGLSLWTRPAADDIVIVAIDDASIAAIGRWPWKRSVHATLLERIGAARPRAVALDLVLSEPDPDPRQDEWLAAAARRAAPVVMPVAWQQLPGAPLRVLEPVAPIRAAVTLGAAEQPVDDDGVLRHAFVEAGPGDAPYPHLAVALLQAAGESWRETTAIERTRTLSADVGWPRQGRFLVRYRGAPGHIQRVSFVDVLRGSVPAERLAGRYVLVGMTALGLGDTLATPVNAGQRAMPGIEVIAHTLQTLRAGEAIRPVSAYATGAIAALGVVVLVAGFAAAGTRAALLLAVASVPLALGLSLLGLGAGVWWGPMPYVAMAVLAYPLWSWRRLERGVDLLDREIARLADEPGLLPPGRGANAVQGRDRLAERLASLHVAADTLRMARSFLADALAGVPTALMVDDGAGRVLLANAPAARLFEVDSPEELQSLDLARLLGEFDCTPPQDWPAALADVRRQGGDVVAQARREGQGDHLIHAHGAPMPGGTRLVVSIADVAPIKKAEREREEMLAFVSHDLRSPAVSIALLVESALAGKATSTGDELLREVRRLAGRTQALADDFVRVLQAEQRPLRPEEVEPQALIREAAADFGAQAEAAGVTLIVQDPGEAPSHCRLDRALVLRAVGNLLSNAIRHSRAGGVVGLACRVDPATGRVACEVSDEGEGLSMQEMQRLMQTHDGLLPGSARGVGFGLLFVQRVAQRHRGRLRVQARPGGGSTFTLELASLAGPTG